MKQKAITATKAVREFSEILNTIKFKNDRYIIERNGKPVAFMGPVLEGKTMLPLKELEFRLRELPKLNHELEAFAADLGDTWKNQPSLPEGSLWE